MEPISDTRTERTVVLHFETDRGMPASTGYAHIVCYGLVGWTELGPDQRAPKVRAQIDTGAGVSVIDPSLAPKGLSPRFFRKARGAFGQEVELVGYPAVIAFLTCKASIETVLYVAPIRDRRPNTDVLIGLDILSRGCLTVDYAKLTGTFVFAED